MIKNVGYTCLIIGICLLIGKFIATQFTGLPASLIGMLLFTTALHFKWANPERISDTVAFIIKNMGVLFVPAGVGIINHYELIKAHGITLIAIIFFTTFILLSFIGLIYQHHINAKLSPKRRRESP